MNPSIGKRATWETPSEAPVALAPQGGKRVQSVDALRGLVMIIMALDHTRDYFHETAFSFQPEDLAHTTTAIFFTRWITHFCAPVFMFTAGIGARFWLSRGHTKGELSAFLAKRGIWLVLLDLTAIRVALTWGAGPLLITVLWGLGWSMIVLALLVHLPIRILGVLSIAAIALHNFADGLNLPVLHDIAVFKWGIQVVIAYPLVPWFAVMSGGFCFGEIFSKKKQWMVPIGLGMTIFFFIIRGIDRYGDPMHWSGGVLSFLKVNKNPPSLDFLLMTLGPAILALALLDRISFSPNNPLLVFGRVPLLYFLAHLYLLHLLTIPLAYISSGKLMAVNPLLRIYPPGYGYDLWVVYMIWMAVVISLYPLCLWFSRLKARRHDWLLSYL